MSTKIIPIHDFEASVESHLRSCCDSKESMIVELSDQRTVCISPLDIEDDADDDLVDNLIAHNQRFRDILARSLASPTRPYRPKFQNSESSESIANKNEDASS